MQCGVPVQLPHTAVFVNTGDPIESENLMEFRLLYQGELLACTNTKRRAKEKHVIRKSFHPQLRRLWSLEENLRDYVYRKSLRAAPDPHTPEERFGIGIQAIGKDWSRAGFELVPLVIPEFALQCSIDVLLLRPSGYIFTQGDIDGQLKTLIDALRIPDSVEEAGSAIPDVDEHPLFCLLQDDKLISEVKVTTDRLLLLPQEKDIKANDCYAVIHVKLNHRNARTFDNYFG